jgi:hypothetical protein
MKGNDRQTQIEPDLPAAKRAAVHIDSPHSFRTNWRGQQQ